MAWEVIREPMFLLLLGAGSIYLVMGDTREALILLGFVVVIMAVTALQERRSDNALEQLRDLSSPRALALRGRTQDPHCRAGGGPRGSAADRRR